VDLDGLMDLDCSRISCVSLRPTWI